MSHSLVLALLKDNIIHMKDLDFDIEEIFIWRKEWKVLKSRMDNGYVQASIWEGFLDLDLFLWVTLNPCLIMDRVLALCWAELTHLLSCTCFGIPTLQDMSLVNWSILTRFSNNLLASPSWNSITDFIPKVWGMSIFKNLDFLIANAMLFPNKKIFT